MEEIRSEIKKTALLEALKPSSEIEEGSQKSILLTASPRPQVKLNRPEDEANLKIGERPCNCNRNDCEGMH